MLNRYSRDFWLLCLNMLLFMTSFNLILPELNEFLSNLGGEDYKGYIFIFWVISAAISRPFSGKLCDEIGRKPIVYFGLIVSAIMLLIYPLSTGIMMFFIIRFLHGFSTGFQPTGVTTWVSDIVQADRRGEAMGIFGITISIGIGLGQFMGSIIAQAIGVEGLFYVASGFGFVSLLLIPGIQEPLESKDRMRLRHLYVKPHEIFDPLVFTPAILMLITATCSGIVFVTAPDHAQFLGIENKGWFLAFYTLSTMVVRVLAGKFSDKYGRRNNLIAGLLVLSISMYITGIAEDPTIYTLSAFAYGIATGINSPALFAWTSDLSNPQFKGRGLATLFICLEIGIGLGAFATNSFYENTFETLQWMYIFGSGIALIGFVFVLFANSMNAYFQKRAIRD
ncbi:MAG: MFS transporter [Crocinitomicaceae bacterium]